MDCAPEGLLDPLDGNWGNGVVPVINPVAVLWTWMATMSPIILVERYPTIDETGYVTGLEL